ncbi:MAG: hypothetical protein C4B59_12905 [Candidatus Methanogaster sp.]|uniref:Uncharacterized protein n=1 Tax=Candidatus Methanogaster sp. TaxID=3386292 RepID=A0AC61L009_9EURY|nr:MAG: hypothetical protein C4B59_12905 [ANME-2 cluster archaeon]
MHCYNLIGALSNNPSVLSPRRSAEGARVFKTVSILTGFSDASALSACSTVKLEDIVISLEFSIVPPQVHAGFTQMPENVGRRLCHTNPRSSGVYGNAFAAAVSGSLYLQLTGRTL